jgi:hypothetical protein
MNETDQTHKPPIQTGRMLACFLVAALICIFCPTPGAWSDRRSRWFPDILLLLLSLCFFVATHWIYIRSLPHSKLQAAILWLIFGGIFIASLQSLYESQLFLSRFGHAGPFDYLKHPSWFFAAPWGRF